MTIIGTIKEIWQFPVKSMYGESVEAAEISKLGVATDRTWAVRDNLSGEIVGGKKIPKLMMLKARYTKDPSGDFSKNADSQVEIEFPDGRRIHSNDPYASAVLSMFLGRSVSLISRVTSDNKSHYQLAKAMTPSETRYALGMKADDPAPDFSSFSLGLLSTVSKYATPPGTYYDVYPLHFMTTAALATVQQLYPSGDFRVERYRPNFLIETNDDLQGLVENEWRGRDLRIGDSVIHCNHPTIRCSMPGAEQPGMAKDPGIPQAVMQFAKQHLGAYGTPKTMGTIRCGDAIELLPRRGGKVFDGINRLQRKLKSSLINQSSALIERQAEKNKASAKNSATKQIPTGFRRFILDSKVQESADILSLSLSDPERSQLPLFIPGQHLVLALPQKNGKWLYRPYSLSNAPGQACYRISVKRETRNVNGVEFHGKGSHWLHQHLNEGDELYIKGPSGHFGSVPSDTKALTLISAGIGITPFMSMIHTLARENPNRSVALFHGVRHPSDLPHAQELQTIAGKLPNFKLRIFVSQPDTALIEPFMQQGRLSASHITQMSQDNDTDYYLCGKPEFNKTILSDLQEHGISQHRIHHEDFGKPLNLNRELDLKRYQIHYAAQSQSIPWEPSEESLLSFSEQHGIELTSGCRYGACGACEVTLSSGEVEYPDGIEQPAGKNKILMCCARPKSDLVIEI